MPATPSGSTLHQPASDLLPSTSGNSFFTPVEHAPSQEGHLHPFLAVPVGPGMTANATTPATSSGSAPAWISGNGATSGASVTGEYNATRPGLPLTTQTSLCPSSASVPTPGLLQSTQPLYTSPSIQRGTDLVMGMFVRMSEAKERLLEENSRLREENENRRIDSDNLREELRKIRAENELLRDKSAAYLASMARAARNTSTPIAESEEDGALLARPSPMPPSPQPGPVEASIAQRPSPAQCAELPHTRTSLSPSSNNDVMTVDIGADIHMPEATTTLQERSADPAPSEADSIKPQVSSIPSSSSPGPFSSKPSRGCASSEPTPSGSPRQSVPASMEKDDLVPKEEIKEEIKEEDDMFVVGSFASPKEENAITLKQEDVSMAIALPSAAIISPPLVPRIKTQESISLDTVSPDSPIRTASPHPMLPASGQLDATRAPDESRRASPASQHGGGNAAQDKALVASTSSPAADVSNQSLGVPGLGLARRQSTSEPAAPSASAHSHHTVPHGAQQVWTFASLNRRLEAAYTGRQIGNEGHTGNGEPDLARRQSTSKPAAPSASAHSHHTVPHGAQQVLTFASLNRRLKAAYTGRQIENEEDAMSDEHSPASPVEARASLKEIARVEESSRADNPFRPKASRQSLPSSSRNGTRVGSMINFNTAPIAALNRETASRSKRKAKEREDGELSEPEPPSRSAASGSGAASRHPSGKPSAQPNAKKFKPAHKVPLWKKKQWKKARSKRKAKSLSAEKALIQESPRSPILDSDDDEIPLLRPFLTSPASSSTAPRPTTPPAVAPNPVPFRSPNASSYDWGLTPTPYPFDWLAVEAPTPYWESPRRLEASLPRRVGKELGFKRRPIFSIIRKEGVKKGPDPCSQEGKNT